MESLKALLAQVGLPPATAPPDPPATTPAVCPQCHGAGYLRRAAPVGHPDFGRLMPCPCRPAPAGPGHPRVRPADALAAFAAQTFATFDAAVPGTAAACTTCQSYAADPTGWLILVGGYGS